MNTPIPTLNNDSEKDESLPIFAEPWEAHAFAIAVKLSQMGLLKWSEWSYTLAKEIKKAKEKELPDLGKTYYQFWLSALETILLNKNILKKRELKIRTAQWRSAYLYNQHGKPVEIEKYK